MKAAAKAILFVEPLILAIVVFAFWFDNPARVNYLPLLILPMLARLILYRRLWVNVAFSLPLYLFLLLCLINTGIALADPAVPPYSFGWYVVGRPLMGVALALSITSIAYERGRVDGIVIVALALALLVSVLGLGSAQFIGKSEQFEFLIRLIPKINNFPGAEGGFNVNEIGGAMAFFAPFAAGIAFYEWQRHRNPLHGVVATTAFLFLALALLLGQSRLAIIGVVVALGGVIFAVIPNGRWRYIALAALGLFSLFEVGIVLGVFESAATASAPGLDARDESGLTQRPVIWNAALTLIREYPLTGYGLNQFRRPEIREIYVPDFAMNIIPHAHDEFLQIGVDLGVPGMLVFLAWHLALVVMVWRTWREGDPFIRVVSISAAAGLLAHAIFGLADAITLFDRFTWAYWLMVGVVGAAYVCRRERITLHA